MKVGNCKEYTDKGYSGKNTGRPKFKEPVQDIKRGLIAKVVVYKLNRISRSIPDFANMIELFRRYNMAVGKNQAKISVSYVFQLNDKTPVEILISELTADQTTIGKKSILNLNKREYPKLHFYRQKFLLKNSGNGYIT